MSADADTRRIAGGPLPSALVGHDAGTHHPVDPDPRAGAPDDPLRLCIVATVALLGWLAGPAALAVFAAVGFVGYWRGDAQG